MECVEDFLSLPAWGHLEDMAEDVRWTMGLVGLDYLLPASDGTSAWDPATLDGLRRASGSKTALGAAAATAANTAVTTTAGIVTTATTSSSPSTTNASLSASASNVHDVDHAHVHDEVDDEPCIGLDAFGNAVFVSAHDVVAMRPVLSVDTSATALDSTRLAKSDVPDVVRDGTRSPTVVGSAGTTARSPTLSPDSVTPAIDGTGHDDADKAKDAVLAAVSPQQDAPVATVRVESPLVPVHDQVHDADLDAVKSAAGHANIIDQAGTTRCPSPPAPVPSWTTSPSVAAPSPSAPTGPSTAPPSNASARRPKPHGKWTNRSEKSDRFHDGPVGPYTGPATFTLDLKTGAIREDHYDLNVYNKRMRPGDQTKTQAGSQADAETARAASAQDQPQNGAKTRAVPQPEASTTPSLPVLLGTHFAADKSWDAPNATTAVPRARSPPVPAAAGSKRKRGAKRKREVSTMSATVVSPSAAPSYLPTAPLVAGPRKYSSRAALAGFSSTSDFGEPLRAPAPQVPPPASPIDCWTGPYTRTAPELPRLSSWIELGPAPRKGGSSVYSAYSTPLASPGLQQDHGLHQWSDVHPRGQIPPPPPPPSSHSHDTMIENGDSHHHILGPTAPVLPRRFDSVEPGPSPSEAESWLESAYSTPLATPCLEQELDLHPWGNVHRYGQMAPPPSYHQDDVFGTVGSYSELPGPYATGAGTITMGELDELLYSELRPHTPSFGSNAGTTCSSSRGIGPAHVHPQAQATYAPETVQGVTPEQGYYAPGEYPEPCWQVRKRSRRDPEAEYQRADRQWNGVD